MENYTDAPKKKSKPKIILFAFVALLLALIYIVVFVRFYQTRDTEQSKIVYFSQRARDLSNGDTFEVYKLSPAAYISKDGMVSLRSVNYLYSSDELQLTVKYKKDVLKEPDNLNPYLFTLTDESGTIFEQYYSVFHEKDNYCYVRLCFTQIKFDFEKKTPIYLSVYDTSIAGGEPLYKLTLYDRNTGAEKIGKYTREDI